MFILQYVNVQIQTTLALGGLRRAKVRHRFRQLEDSLRQKREMLSSSSNHDAEASVAQRHKAALIEEVKAEEASISLEQARIKEVDEAILEGRYQMKNSAVKADIERAVDAVRLEIQEEARFARLNQEVSHIWTFDPLSPSL